MEELAALTHFLAGQLPTAGVGAVRRILDGDELLLRPSERAGLESAVLTVRRASGAGRDVARRLCERMGVRGAEIPRSVDRVPLWPDRIVGSITHDDAWAAAVVADARRLGGIGIDIEPPRGQPEDVARLIGSPDELEAFSGVAFGETVLFSLKEAIFKSVYPHDRQFLDFHDVLVDAVSSTAATRYGRTVHWRALSEPRILTIAWW
jgi:4'-phosphopantetheinyl transferase EntD